MDIEKLSLNSQSKGRTENIKEKLDALSNEDLYKKMKSLE